MSIPATQRLLPAARVEPTLARDDAERQRAARYPISRWYLRPAAGLLAAALVPTSVRPWHLTLGGLLAAVAAGSTLIWHSSATSPAAGFVLAAWFFDRCDGLLARRQGTASPLGAWLDANIDELVDVGLHVAVAFAAANVGGSSLPWLLLMAFLAGKYLFVYGLAEERQIVSRLEPGPDREGGAGATAVSAVPSATTISHGSRSRGTQVAWLKRLYHLPSNADVRVHLLAGALACGWLTAELALIAVYYNARWIARYVLVARRLRGGAA